MNIHVDIDKKSNLWWLVRNVDKTNGNHPKCKELLNLIKEELFNVED